MKALPAMLLVLAATGVLWGGAFAGNDHAGGHDGAEGASPAESGVGEPARPDAGLRTIRIGANDSMRFRPRVVRVRPGESVRFLVTNSGQLVHEFVLGDAAAQREHAQMMADMPDMQHEHPNAITVRPQETRALYWKFAGPGDFEAACHVPGHYEAGMKLRISVRD